MPPVLDDALCIRHWDWSETSQTVSLFTRNHGLVRALAKGSKRPKAPYSGGVELLTRGQAAFIIRPSSELALLTAWDLEETYPALRADLAAHNAGLYIADLLHHAITDHDPHPALFERVAAILRLIGAGPDARGLALALLRFQWSVLVETGYAPVVDADAATGEPLPAAPTYHFSPALGGVLAEPSHRDAAPWPVRAETIQLLRALAAGADLAANPPATVTLDRANRLLAAYLRHVLGREPPTLPLLFGHDLPV